MIRGLVLAGGKSTRFGSDKALAVCKGKTLIERAVRLLESLHLNPVVVTRNGADYSFTGCTVLRDSLPEKGPLGGLYTAMTVFEHEAFLVLTCDMPFVDRQALTELLLNHHERSGMTVFRTDDSALQPFPGIYEYSVFPEVRRRLLRGDLAVRDMLEGHPAKKVIFWKWGSRVFCNVNRPADFNMQPC